MVPLHPPAPDAQDGPVAHRGPASPELLSTGSSDSWSPQGPQVPVSGRLAVCGLCDGHPGRGGEQQPKASLPSSGPGQGAGTEQDVSEEPHFPSHSTLCHPDATFVFGNKSTHAEPAKGLGLWVRRAPLSKQDCPQGAAPKGCGAEQAVS